MIGRSVNHYRIDALLGAGGMGSVYRGTDTRSNLPVALKLLSPTAVANPERRRRFLQESKAASSLSHKGIVTIFETGKAEIDGQSIDFIAMELVAGETLSEHIGAIGLPIREALDYAIQIAAAIARAHAAGIVHRDLKPSNVMVTPDRLVKVLDFGLAKILETESVDDYAATQTAALQTEDAQFSHRRLHVARTSGGEAAGRENRHLFVWLRFVRDADGEEGLLGRLQGFDAIGGSAEGTSTAPCHPFRHSRGAGTYSTLPAEGSPPPLSDHGRHPGSARGYPN